MDLLWIWALLLTGQPLQASVFSSTKWGWYLREWLWWSRGGVYTVGAGRVNDLSTLVMLTCPWNSSTHTGHNLFADDSHVYISAQICVLSFRPQAFWISPLEHHTRTTCLKLNSLALKPMICFSFSSTSSHLLVFSGETPQSWLHFAWHHPYCHVSLSLSLSHTHTHTHTHRINQSLCPTGTNFFSISIAV